MMIGCCPVCHSSKLEEGEPYLKGNEMLLNTVSIYSHALNKHDNNLKVKICLSCGHIIPFIDLVGEKSE